MGKQKVELVMWETVRADCKYPKEDNNNSFIHGLNLMDDNDEIIDVQWFKTNEERIAFIAENNLEIFEF